MFFLEQQLNVQNDRVWSASLSDIPGEKLTVPRYQNASAVMLWGAISRKGRLPLVFIDRVNLKINTILQKKEFLQRISPPEAQKLYEDEYYCFQQDGAPSHTANRGDAKII
jgi:hypothetical protein